MEGGVGAREPVQPEVSWPELMAAASLAADTGMGEPLETGLGTCLVALELGRRLGLDEAELRRTYHLALLQHIGCTTASEEAAEVTGDELLMRQHSSTLDFSDQREMFVFMLAPRRACQPRGGAPPGPRSCTRRWTQAARLDDRRVRGRSAARHALWLRPALQVGPRHRLRELGRFRLPRQDRRRGDPRADPGRAGRHAGRQRGAPHGGRRRRGTRSRSARTFPGPGGRRRVPARPCTDPRTARLGGVAVGRGHRGGAGARFDAAGHRRRHRPGRAGRLRRPEVALPRRSLPGRCRPRRGGRQSPPPSGARGDSSPPGRLRARPRPGRRLLRGVEQPAEAEAARAGTGAAPSRTTPTRSWPVPRSCGPSPRSPPATTRGWTGAATSAALPGQHSACPRGSWPRRTSTRRSASLAPTGRHSTPTRSQTISWRSATQDGWTGSRSTRSSRRRAAGRCAALPTSPLGRSRSCSTWRGVAPCARSPAR